MKNFDLKTFDFILPEELIAQNPLDNKEETKLLALDENYNITDLLFNNILDFLNPNDLIIFNNTKVIPARLIGKKDQASLNITLHYKIDDRTWLSFIKNSRRLKEEDEIIFAPDFKAKVLEKLSTGEVKLFFDYDNIFPLLERYGFMPLPPYIKRENINSNNDKINYQSIFAKKEGAVASPTASLHFTKQVLKKLEEKGIEKAFITLHVGAGTFLPVKVENIKNHKMHKEYGEISQETSDKINSTLKRGGKIIAIGTTVLRTLEYVAKTFGEIKPFNGEIDLFIYPSFKFKVVDRILTNFHLPKSTLFMLVCATSNIETMQKVYKYAINNKYRFFSYGDCCFLPITKEK